MANQNANDNDTNVINADNNSTMSIAMEMNDHDAYEKSAMSAADQRARQEDDHNLSGYYYM